MPGTETVSQVHLENDFAYSTNSTEMATKHSILFGLSEWLDSSTYNPRKGRAAAKIEGIGKITPHTSKGRLVEMAKAIRFEATVNNVVLDGDPLAYVSELRRECREMVVA